jgi:hypothetical protein
MSDIQHTIDGLRRSAEQDTKRADGLQLLLAAYPDLKRHVDRWDKETFCSRTVNAKVISYDMKRNCGCCADTPVEVWPYLDTSNGRVHSDPPCFRVGNQDPESYTYVARFGWEEGLRSAGIPDEMIGRIGLSLSPAVEPELTAEVDYP